MTDTVRCLFVDDRPGDVTHFRFPIERAWNSLGTGFTLAFTERTSFEEGLREIQTHGDKYDLFILDYYFPLPASKKVYPSGKQLVEAAKSFKHAAILVLTAEPEGKADALRHGAHAAVLKDDVEYGDTEFLAPELAKATARLNLQPENANQTIQITDDRIALVEIVERVGRGHIQVILQRLNPYHQPLEKASVSYVAPGFSGAAVLRADCQFSGGAKKLLLKVSRDGAKLAEEIQNIGDAGQFPANSFLRCESEGPHASGGWYGIQALFDEDALTLHEKITSAALSDGSMTQIEDILKRVGSNTVRKEEGSVLRAFDDILTASRRARAEVVMSELQPLLERHCAHPDAAAVGALVKTGVHLPGIPDKQISKGTWYHFAHGDLHSRNILVNSFGVPRIIDASEVRQRIWCADATRLMVDVFLSAWMHGVDAYEWRLMHTWEDAARALIHGEDWSGMGFDTTAWHVASRIRASVLSQYPHVESQRAWEFVLGCAVEFMRSTYRADLPAPKRVLALAAAEEALRFARETFESAGITAL